MKISYSGLDTFTQCPAKYKFQYIERIRTPKSKEAIFGTLIHDCLKVLHEPSRPIPLSEDELLKYFANKWDNSAYPDKQEEAFAFHQGVDILKNYYLRNQGVRYNILTLETSFVVPISDSQISGRIDRIDKLDDGTFEIIDYKTSRKMPSQEDVDRNFQLSVYYLGLINRWPHIQNKSIKLSLYFLKHGEKISTARTKEQIEQSKERIVSLIGQIQQSKFEPKPNPLCDWCAYQAYCSLFKHKFIKQQPSNINIKQIIKEYFEVKNRQSEDTKKITELKKLINQYCDENKIERVFGDEGYITRLPQQRFSYDFEKVKEILRPLGKWNAILTIDQTKLKKVINSLPYHLKEEIEKTKILNKEFKVITAKANTSQNSRI